MIQVFFSVSMDLVGLLNLIENGNKYFNFNGLLNFKPEIVLISYIKTNTEAKEFLNNYWLMEMSKGP